MTIYSILENPERGPEAVEVIPDRFIWSAALFSPLWALFNRAWGFVLLWCVLLAVVVASRDVLGTGGAVSLYLLLALWTGFAASGIKRRAMEKRGWMPGGEWVARSTGDALALWLDRRYGAVR